MFFKASQNYKAAKALANTIHVDLSSSHVTILSRHWLEYPQLRYHGSQLLAGAILVDKNATILLNTIETYCRDQLLDAHYERETASYSSFPETPGRYGLITINLFNTPDGNKLIIGTRSCNFLVTSSMRLDTCSVNVGPTTTHFTPSSATRVFLDKSSLDTVTPVLNNKDINECQVMPSLYQLRQNCIFEKLQPILHHAFYFLLLKKALVYKLNCIFQIYNLSTEELAAVYTKCHASMLLLSRPYFQSVTIWTLSSQEGTTQTGMSQDRVASLVFRTLATKVFADGRSATININGIKEISSLTKNTSVATILNKVIRLFRTQDNISIIGNSNLNSQLVDLTGNISKQKEDKSENTT